MGGSEAWVGETGDGKGSALLSALGYLGLLTTPHIIKVGRPSTRSRLLRFPSPRRGRRRSRSVGRGSRRGRQGRPTRDRTRSSRSWLFPHSLPRALALAGAGTAKPIRPARLAPWPSPAGGRRRSVALAGSLPEPRVATCRQQGYLILLVRTTQ